MQAVKSNDFILAKSLIGKGAKADYEFYEEGTWGAMDRYSPIHEALNRSNKEIILLLLENGAKPNSVSESRNWKGSGQK